MKKVMTILGATALLASCNQGGVNKNAKLSSELDSVSYSLGVLIGSDIAKNTDKDAPLKQELVFSGLSAGFDNDTVVLTREKAMQIFQAHMQKQQQKRMEKAQKELAKRKEDGNKFLEENKKKEGVVTTESGLQYQVIKKGKGKMAQKGQIAVVNYTGTLTDGKVFDSSLKEGRKPFEVPVAEGRVIKGWDEALQLMNVGTKLKLFIPSELAYGDRAMGADIPAGSVLIFDVELLELKNKAKK